MQVFVGNEHNERAKQQQLNEDDSILRNRQQAAEKVM